MYALKPLVLYVTIVTLTFTLTREKKLLVASDDYGRDLTGVQNLLKKHKRLEAELASHEPAIQAVQVTTRMKERKRERVGGG